MKKQAFIVVLWIALSLIVVSCSSAEDDRMIEQIDEPEVLDTATPVLVRPTEQVETPVPIEIDTATATETDQPQEPTPTQEIQDSSGDGLLLEQQLQALGFVEVGMIDGVLDDQTALAVKHLQWLNGMPLTGEVDPALYQQIMDGDLMRPVLKPPFLARALAHYLPGGIEIGFLKGRLVDLGYLDSADPGFNPYAFDGTTDAAVKEFQKLNGIPVNGKVDFSSWQVLFSQTVVMADGEFMLTPNSDVDWSTDFFPILNDPIDLAYDGQYLWVLHSSGDDAFDNLLVRIDPQAGLLGQAPPVLVGDSEAQMSEIVEMLYDGNRLWFLIPRAWEPPQIISLIPEYAEKFIHTTIMSGGDDGFSANALGFDGKTLWATDNDRAWAINRNTGKGYLSYQVGWLTQGEMAFDGKCMWMAGESGLTTFHTGGNYPCIVSAEAYRLPGGPVVFDGKRIWSADWNALYWLDVKSGMVGDPVMVGSGPSALIYDGLRLWVANEGDDTVQGIDPATGSVGPVIPTGRRPVALAYDGKWLWAANAGDRTLQRIDIQDYQIEIIQPTATPIPSPTVTRAPTATRTLPPLERNLRLITPNMRGDDVLLLQQRLFYLGYTEVGQADGVFGAKTDQAVRHFQTLNDLTVDGIVGPMTWEVLFSGNANSP
jgi:YVTN family beta-propeller protein